MPQIFLDESGNFARDGSPYFVIASFTISDPKRTEKRFRSWQRSKFPKKLQHVSEIKFSNPGISTVLRYNTLQFIARLDIRIRYTYLKLSNVPEQYRHHESFRDGHLYAHIIAETIEKYLPPTDGVFQVFCDQRSLKGLSQGAFIKELIDRFRPQVPRDTLLDIRMIDSTKTANMQIADWVAGALAARLNGKSEGESYYLCLRNNIVSEQELFKDLCD